MTLGSASPEHAASRELPANDGMEKGPMTERVDVVVVGLGPVGAVMAHLLAQSGLSVVAVDMSPDIYDKPRAIGIDHESLRLLQQIGIADALAPYLGGYRPSEYRSASGQVLRRILPLGEPYPLYWPPYNTFLQPELERLLRESFGRYERLETLLGWRAVSFAQTDKEAVVTIESVADGATRDIRALYVVGCDGAWSPVREAMGLKFEDLEFDEPWLVVDALVGDDVPLPSTTVQYCDPARPATFVRGPGNLKRWEIMLLPGEDPAEMVAEEKIWQLLSRWLTPDQGSIWRAATYRFHALVAESWRAGRYFIAGDAAHQTPPFMAQGLNQGLRDVGNLAWKIVQVVAKGADPALLDSYDLERRPNARSVIDLTKTLGRLICELDPVAAAARDERLLEEMRTGKGEVVRQDLIPPLVGGFLLQGKHGEPSSGTGTAFPQPLVETDQGERRLDDVLGHGFLLLVPPSWTPSNQDLELATRHDVTLVSLGGSQGQVRPLSEQGNLISAWLERHGCTSVLVRPDHIVFGTSTLDSGPSDLLMALHSARGLRNSDTPAFATI